MKTAPHSHFDSALVEPLKVGSVDYGDTACRVYAVFNRAAAEKAVGFPVTASSGRTFAQELTGLAAHYGGPGRAFAEEPVLQVRGQKLLVTQRLGVDC